MGQSLSSPRLLVLIAALAVISILSGGWIYLQLKQQHQLDRNSLAKQTATIQSLQTQVESLNDVNAQLAKNYEQSENDKKNTIDKLHDLMAMDWENKYEAMKNENNILSEENAASKYQYDIEIARLNRAQKFLSAEIDSLKKSANENIETNDKNLQIIAGLRAEVAKNKKTITKLEKAAEKSPEKIQPDITATVTKQEPVKAQADSKIVINDKKMNAYRLVRIQSLNNAMLNQDSGTRRMILMNVIPTIPEGISDIELLSLIDGMQSEDILAVIKNTNQYVNRPLDNQTINSLVAHLNENDAQIAESILFKNNNPDKQ